MKPAIILTVVTVISMIGSAYLWGRYDGEKGRSYTIQYNDVKAKLPDLLGKAGISCDDEQIGKLNRLLHQEKIGFQQQRQQERKELKK